MDKPIQETNEVRYVVKVNGLIVGPGCITPELALAQIAKLSEAHQLIAEVVTVDMQGREILLG